jgi:catechol 2,3-dioxygenase-like lactoylglutathione lyase family enzyme
VCGAAVLALLGLGLHVATGQAAVRTLAYDNVHVAVTDPAAAKEWYVTYLGATERDDGLIYFGDTLVRLVSTDTVRPSAGSVIDHIGLSFVDLEATVAHLREGGATVEGEIRDVPGLFKLVFFEDPWGVRFEGVEDPEWPDFHHVHLRVSDPEATLAWFENTLGGTREQLKGRIDGLRYGGVWLLAAGAEGDVVVPSTDRAIRNVAWRVPDLEAATAEFKRMGVTVVSEPKPFQNLTYAFFLDPNGVRVELLEYGQ